MPSLSSGEKVIDEAGDSRDAARLVAAKDFTGHRYTRLDIVAGHSLTQYRVSKATGLVLVNEVLVIESPAPRLVPLVQTLT